MNLKIVGLLTLLLLGGLTLSAQDASDYLIVLQGDLVKTDNGKPFEKAQIGVEVNYFMNNKFTATTGFEVWTDDEVSFVVGARYFPTENGFVRARGLIGENDVSIGGGWTMPINENFRFEATADFYFTIDFSIRAGFVYVIRR